MVDQQPTMSTDGRLLQEDTPLSQEALALVDVELQAEQARLALGISRYIVIITIVIAVPLLTMFIFTRRYAQSAFLIALLGPILLASLAYPHFYRRGQAIRGLRVFMVAFLAIAVYMPILMHSTLPLAGILTVTVIVLAHALLRSDVRGALIVFAVLAYVANVGLNNVWVPPWVSPMSPAIETGIAMGLVLIALVFASLVARLVVSGQQQQLRRLHVANLEIEQRSMTELEQYEQLEQTKRAIETQAASEQAHRERLETLLEQVQTIAIHLQNAAAEIAAAADRQQSAMSEQDAAVNQTMATVQQSLIIVRQMAEKSQIVSAASNDAVIGSQEGELALQKTVVGMHEIGTQVDSIAQTIHTLEAHTRQIGEIIAVVRDLADQSKLLALNAAIEAARAGEQGRGFAVVAMEVRALAEQSQEATGRVRDILSEIEAATQAAVTVTAAGSTTTTAGVELVELAEAAIRVLTAMVDDAAQVTLQISESSQQQASGMAQLAQAVVSIQQLSADTAASTRQTATSAANLNMMAEQMMTLVSHYRE